LSAPHAVIIAGGRGARLGGVRKADLRIGGARLIDRVTARLGGIAVPAMVAIGAAPYGGSLPADSVPVADLAAPVAGPLAGLAAAVAHLRQSGIAEGVLVSVAVDTPFLPERFAAAMSAALGKDAAVFATWGEAFYPPNAAWRLEALADLPARVLQGKAPKSLRALLEEIGARRVDWTAEATQDPFCNLNTLDDLLALGRIARG
jgi:molybdopterin-guanine dinucleotide biosynthesis protein A